jgi:Lon protease-like protein
MTRRKLSIFPLTGAILFPGLQLPLHIFEPRYRAMIGDALARDRRIGMIQPQPAREGSKREGAPLFAVGCVGKIEEVETSEDGRYNIVLTGETRFRVVNELQVSTPFRQVEAELIEDAEGEILSLGERAALEYEARKFADAQGYQVDWDSVARLDDMTLVNGFAQIAPFDAASKQALLEAPSLRARCEVMVQLLEFFGKGDPDEDRVTLQ